MRSKNRILPILFRIAVLWYRYSDLRLGQLIINAIDESKLYYIEDEDLITKLEDHYNK